jgi:hypothetical protein
MTLVDTHVSENGKSEITAGIERQALGQFIANGK